MTPRLRRSFAVLLAGSCLVALPRAARSAAAQQSGTAPADTSTADARLPISARGALLRSFAIPGWGQSYAGAPGRGALYFAMEAGSLWMVYKTQRQLSASRQRDRWLRETGALEERRISPLTRARSQQFEDWVTLSIFLLLFSGADAYVTAQLSDFAEQVEVGPGSDGALRIEAGIPVGGVR